MAADRTERRLSNAAMDAAAGGEREPEPGAGAATDGGAAGDGMPASDFRAGRSRAGRGGMLPKTLRWRLALWVAAVVVSSFAITLAAVYSGTGSAVSQQIERRLTGDVESLQSALAEAHPDDYGRARQAAEDYVRSLPFRSDSTLLFVLLGGRLAATNQPELLSGRAEPERGESAAEQRRENRARANLLSAREGQSTLYVPDVGDVRLLRRSVLIGGSRRGPRGPSGPGDPDGERTVRASIEVTIVAGESLAPVRSAQAGVAKAFVLAGILVLFGALLSAYLLGSRLSLPLRRMAAVAAQVDAGDLAPRIAAAGSQPEELRVLAESFNHMLDRLTEAFARQRAFVADASHELRTPLTVIRGQIELLLTQPDPPAAEVARVGRLVEAEADRIARLVDDLLALVKAERRELMRLEEIELRPYVEKLWESVGVLAQRSLELGELPDGRLRGDGDRIAQALRNLLVNAIDHTAAPGGRVRLSAVAVAAAPRGSADGGHPSGRSPDRSDRPGRECTLRFIVEDDGPGIAPAERALIFDRFHRTDHARGRSSGGAGLGLSIVRAIAIAHGGSVRALESPLGGASLELELPGFLPQAGAPHQQRERNGAAATAAFNAGAETGRAAPKSGGIDVG